MSKSKELLDATDVSYKDFSLVSHSILEGQSRLISEFSSFYKSRGYIQVEPVGLLSDQDQSVIFTGSTISPLKTYLKDDDVPNPGLFIVQPCLRTQKKDYFYDDSSIPDYSSYFTQAGILAPASQYRKVCDESLSFLCESLGVNRGDILIHASSETPELTEHVASMQGLNIVIDQYTPEYYKWTYGIPDVSGKGVTYSVKSGEHGFRDIGNIILIYKDDNPIAVEWGFGIETLMSRIFDLPKPQAASKIAESVPFVTGVQEKMLDSLVASIEMYKLGIRPGSGKGNYVLKTYLKGLNYLRHKLNLNIEDIENIASGYLNDDMMNDNLVGEISAFLAQQDTNLEYYKVWSRDITASCKARKIDPTESLIRLRQKLGIHIKELIN